PPAARREALLANPLFRPMQPAQLDEILGFAVERHCPRGTTIFSKGDPGSSMMAVLAGRVRIAAMSAEGREITLNVIGPGEFFGEIALLDGQPRTADAVAIEETRLLVVERRHFLPFLLRHGELVEALLGVLCGRLRRTSLALEELALFELPVRLARLLLKLAADYGRPAEGGTRIDLKLSQRDLGTLVAGSRESVNKLLRQWQGEGVIARADGHVVLLRPQALRALLEQP
ncbi:MAG: Crp/Fnr family transcriptional regulator, partial [Rhodospirillales bacterium]|nr:Crp/Fnr family transcriptional regulator [Rhodospirillales bacterium]